MVNAKRRTRKRRSGRSALGWCLSLLARDLRRELSGRGRGASAGLRAFEALFPPASKIGRQLARMDALTAHEGRLYQQEGRRARRVRVLRSRILAVVLLEQSGRDRAPGCPTAGQIVARGRELWQGRHEARTADGTRTAPERRGGLASRLRCATKTIQRLWRRLEDAGIGRAHQPRAAGEGGAAPDRLPAWMVGVRCAYLVWTWATPLPPEARRARWGEAVERRSGAPPDDGPRRPGPEGQALAAALLATLA